MYVCVCVCICMRMWVYICVLNVGGGGGEQPSDEDRSVALNELARMSVMFGDRAVAWRQFRRSAELAEGVFKKCFNVNPLYIDPCAWALQCATWDTGSVSLGLLSPRITFLLSPPPALLTPHPWQVVGSGCSQGGCSVLGSAPQAAT